MIYDGNTCGTRITQLWKSDLTPAPLVCSAPVIVEMCGSAFIAFLLSSRRLDPPILSAANNAILRLRYYRIATPSRGVSLIVLARTYLTSGLKNRPTPMPISEPSVSRAGADLVLLLLCGPTSLRMRRLAAESRTARRDGRILASRLGDPGPM